MENGVAGDAPEEGELHALAAAPGACADEEAAYLQAAIVAAFDAAPEGMFPCVACLQRDPTQAARYFQRSRMSGHYASRHRNILRCKHKKQECNACYNLFKNSDDRDAHIRVAYKRKHH